MSPLRIEAKEATEIIRVKTDEVRPSVTKLDADGEESNIELGKTYPLLPGEIVLIPDSLREFEIETNSGLKVSKRPSGWTKFDELIRNDEVSIQVVARGYGLSGEANDHPALHHGEPSIKSSETIRAHRLSSPVTVWANKKPIAVISWEKGK